MVGAPGFEQVVEHAGSPVIEGSALRFGVGDPEFKAWSRTSCHPARGLTCNQKVAY
jgi:hypothetical protein